MTDNIKAISDLENKYGLVLFRMALTHLVDVGVRHMTDENVEETVNQIVAKDKTDRANGIVTLMTADFQCDIVRCAAELSKFSISELFYYIKEHVVVSLQ